MADAKDNDLTAEQKKLCRSWKKLRCAIRMKAPKFEFWLVPEYTDKERLELTPEHFFKIHSVMDAFGTPAEAIKMIRQKPHVPYKRKKKAPTKPKKVPY